jgi:hypothetical protein
VQRAICCGSRSSHVTGMIAALDARGRTGRRRSVLPMQSDVTCGLERIRSGCSPGRTRCWRRHIQGLGARTLSGAPGLSDLEPGKSSLRALRPGRFRELKSGNGDQEIPARRWNSLAISAFQTEKTQESREAPLPLARVPRLPRRISRPTGPRRIHCRASLVFCGNRPPGDGAHDLWLCPSRLFQSRVTRISPRGPKRRGESIPVQSYDSGPPLPRPVFSSATGKVLSSSFMCGASGPAPPLHRHGCRTPGPDG